MSEDERKARKEYMRQYRLKNLDKWKRTPEQQEKINKRRRELYALQEDRRIQARQAAKDWHTANPEKRKSQRLRKHGITLEEFLLLFQSQAGRCAICGYSGMSDPNIFPLVDHCHKTGAVRGLLCLNCNQALGKFKDDPHLLRNAIRYLQSRG